MHTAKEYLTKLVSFPVIGGYGNISIIEYIKGILDEYKIEYHLVFDEEDETKASLHCRIGPSADGGVVLSGHTDVVPVEGQAWDTDPWVLTEKDGKLYGRGSCDMKGFIACCLACLPDMVKANLKKPIYFAFSYDEEVGCLAGDALAQSIMDTYEETPKYAIIGEPSMMEPITGQKGIVVYETNIYGSAGHSSRIRQDVSAIHEAAHLITWLDKKMDELVAAKRFDDRFTPNHTSLHSGIINGGIATNVIADHCKFYWDLRNIPMDDVNDIKADFDAYVKERLTILQKRFADTQIKTTLFHDHVPSLDTSEKASVVSLVQRLTGKNNIKGVSYASEAGQFANAGFESVICGPGSIAQAHRANEFIAIEQLEKGVTFLQDLLVELS